MQTVVENMMTHYSCQSLTDYVNALKEIIQKIALLALWRAKFFEKAAFYGGTALRILYGLNRYSEDMDFSLLKPDPHFNLDKYNEAIRTELESFGFSATIHMKEKRAESNIKTTLIKLGAKEQLITVSIPKEFLSVIHKDQKISIKMEVDTNPPLNFETEQKVVLNPIPFYVNTYQKSSLFATKIHAILCRNWGSRTKGRDWYDFVWYISHNVAVDLIHLKTRLVQSGDWTNEKDLDCLVSQELLYNKLQSLDIEAAKKDVLPFIMDKTSIEIWSNHFFETIISHLRAIPSHTVPPIN